MQRNRTLSASRGFSLIELVIVVVIIGIIAAIAIPRISRGSAGAADSALAGDLAVLRNAIDLYATEHAGTFPSSTDATFVAQLTTYTDASGGTSATRDATHIYGPYLRKVPPLPIGPANYKGSAAIIDSATAIGTSPGGWHYNATTGEIKPNVLGTLADSAGKNYVDY